PVGVEVAARRVEPGRRRGVHGGGREVVLGGEVVVEAALSHAARREHLAGARGGDALRPEELLRGGDEARTGVGRRHASTIPTSRYGVEGRRRGAPVTSPPGARSVRHEDPVVRWVGDGAAAGAGGRGPRVVR